MGPLPYSEYGFLPPHPEDDPERLAEWIAGAIDRWWHQAGRPDPYPVVEVGAGDGTRAARVLGLGPECLDALRYILVGSVGAEFVLPVEAPAFLFPPGESDDPDETPPPATGFGPIVTSLDDLPRLSGVASVFAVDWLSRLPSDRVEWHEGHWHEVRLAAAGEKLAEVLVPLDAGRHATLDALIPRPSEGGRFALLGRASAWVGSALRTAESGVLAVVDHWTETTEPNKRDEAPPLAVDQLSRARRPRDPGPEPVLPGLGVVTWSLG
jgi:hypothetical protein